jgi:hypothetical protein
MKQIVILILLVFCISASAQTPRANADEAGRTLEQCLGEVERLRAACKTGEEVRTLEAKVKAAEDLIIVYKAMVEHEANEGREQANVSAGQYVEMQERIRGFEARALLAKESIAILQRESRHLRKSRNIAVGIVIALGVGLAWALGK